MPRYPRASDPSNGHLQEPLGQDAEIPLGRPPGQNRLDFRPQDLPLQRRRRGAAARLLRCEW